MSYLDLHLDAKKAIARTSIAAWNALMRTDPEFGRYALSDAGRSVFLVTFTVVTFTVVKGNEWRVAGKLHCVNGPARITRYGRKEWYERGQLHRTDGPAIVHPDGSQTWYERGVIHRAGGLPACWYPNSGYSEWREHGKLHRIGGPAIIYGTAEMWYERGVMHRIGTPGIPGSGGPAVTRANGDTEYWEHGIRV